MSIQKLNKKNFVNWLSRYIVIDKINEITDLVNSDLTNSGTATLDIINPYTSGGDITFNAAVVRKNTASAINATATATAAQVAGGLITSTSAAATSITLPTATQLGTQLGAVQGTMFDFVVDNTAGSNTVTIIVGSGIVAAKQVSSGDTAVDALLTVAASATVGIGLFRLVFSSATAAILYRVG
jgi:hypothetical protein